MGFLRVQNLISQALYLKGVVNAPLLTSPNLMLSVAAIFFEVNLPLFGLRATVWVFHQDLGRTEVNGNIFRKLALWLRYSQEIG